MMGYQFNSWMTNSWVGNCFNYMGNRWGAWGMPFSPVAFFGLGSLILTILIIWSLYWKGMALWKAVRLGEKWWFIAMLIINTVGILEIFYIYIFSKKEDKSEPIEKKQD